MNEQRDKDTRVRELLAERALFELSSAEQEELRQLLAESSIDQESFERAAAMAVLALNPGPHEPLPANLKSRVAAAAPAHIAAARKYDSDQAADTGSAPRIVSSVAGTPSERRSWETLAWLAAAASLLIAVSTWWYSRPTRPVVQSFADQRDQLLKQASDAMKIDWKPAEDPNGKDASGDIVWSNHEQKGFMRFNGLAKNDPQANQYQLWIFDAKQDERYPIDGGVFDVDRATGDVIVPIRAAIRVVEPKMFAVTVEKPGGVVVSSRKRLALIGQPPG